MTVCVRNVLLSVGVTLLLAGCGGGGSDYTPEPGVAVKGVLVNGGTPVTTIDPDGPYGVVEMSFVPANAETEGDINAASASSTDETGAFMFVGNGGGVEPGKYKITVFQDDPNSGEDMFKGKFSMANTPIEVEVPADKLGGEIDLGEVDLAKYE